MNLVIQQYSVEEGKPRDGPNCAIPREHIPSWDNLAHWAGQQILEEGKTKEPFQHAIESFIIAYSDHRGFKLPKVCLASDFFFFLSLSLANRGGFRSRSQPNSRRLFLGCRHVTPPSSPPHGVSLPRDFFLGRGFIS